MKYTPQTIEEALKAEGVTGVVADLARSIYMQESSGGKNTQTSNRGAVGGMQVLPGTFKEVADKGWDINDPLLNARAGVRYLGKMNQLAKGDPTLTAIGYYGGPGGIDAARRGIARKDPKNPTFPDTFRYAQEAVGRIPGMKQAAPMAAPVAAAPQLVQKLPSARNGAEETTQFGFQPTPEILAALRPQIADAPTTVDQAPVYKQAKEEAPWQDFLQAMPIMEAPAVDFSRWMQPPKAAPGPANMFNPGGFQPFGFWTSKG
jgi:hypothetical protein